MEILPIDNKSNSSINKNLYNKKNEITKLKKISQEDSEIIFYLNKVKKDLAFAHKSFDTATDSALIDSFIYEILSLNKMYDYYIQICKQKGLIAEGF